MTNPSSSTAWWQKSKEAGLENRIQDINRYRDPTTNSDEVLRASRIVLSFLLILTCIMAAFSYARNFSAFPPPLAWAFAIGLAAAIEFGKNYCATWAIRTPFFLGWGHLRQAPENTLRWFSLVLVALVTFAASVYNSTKGAKQISAQLAYEQQHSAFQPNTADIDAQIAGAEKRIERNNQNVWKGVVIFESQKANKVETRNIEALQKQRASRMAQQRTDWEKEQASQAENRDYASSMVLAAGGWMEVLQVLLMLLRVSCEKSLHGRMGDSPTPTAKAGIGFRQQQTHPAYNHEPRVPTAEERRPIGFSYPNRDVPLEPHYASHSGLPVSQVTQAVTQRIGPQESVGAGEALRNIRTDLMRDVRNLETRNGVPATVLTRIEGYLWKAIELHQAPGFMPGARNYQIFGDYIFGDFSDKMVALEANCAAVDKAHYLFIRTNRTDLLQREMTERGGNINVAIA